MKIEELEYAAPKTPQARMLWFISLLAIVNLMRATQGPAIKLLDPYHLSAMTITFLPFYPITLALTPFLYWKRKSNRRRSGRARFDDIDHEVRCVP